MVPAPHANTQTPSTMGIGSKKETIVISGISGMFPKSQHIEDFTNILYNKIDPVANSKPRWDIEDPEVPKFHGKIPHTARFDAQFFKVSSHLAKCMDPMARKLLEQSYRAIYDAGLSINHVIGKNIGVFVGASLAETEKVGIYDADVTAHSMPGCSKAMFANRISYFMDLKGPSMMVENICCTSEVVLEQACLAIQRGDCEAAIVGAAHICFHPQTVVQFGRMMPFSKDCKTKSFDQSADGCAKSEAVSVMFLQKKENAARIYAEVVHVKSEFDKPIDPKLPMLRKPDTLADFWQRFYKEAGVSPNEVGYLEAFGAGIPEVDKSELEAIEKVFCTNRRDPLLVGSVMSNIGYTEAASGLCSVVKVLLAYKKRLLASNLHCANPRKDIKALCEGRMRIVNEHEPFNGVYAAVNTLSFGGVNGHILLRAYQKPKVAVPKPSIPYLITISGRNESSVQKIIDDLKTRPVDNEEVALLHNIYKEKNVGNLSRGFVILDSDKDNKTSCLAESATFYDDIKRPLWFVYSGMGSQWATMGAHLMKIPVFAAAIERCHKALAPKGLDLVYILTANDKTIYDNILHSFVGIAAVQIGLTDVLREMGIVPDNIIGHSVGELGCGYADGCFTAEEMILSAYSRGLVSVQTKFIYGSMAAVGIGYQQAVKLCPPEIEVACHNGPESCTISGPADVMREFVAKLTAQGIFAKEVPCSNIAYHSRYIAQAGPKLLEYLSQVIKNPKRRSERWVSTSIPQEMWGEENAQYCSAWYHTNNLLNPVLFEETARLIPAGAVLVEIAPHGLLQAILKRSLHPDCRHIPLTRRGHGDNSLYLLEAVGKLFTQGYHPDVAKLYPKVEFPVSSQTPGLSHLLQWNDSDKWVLPLRKLITKEETCICKFLISIHDPENNYLQGHVIRGQMLYPHSAVLVSVWDTLAMSSGFKRKEISVQFRDVNLYTQPILHDKRYLKLKVSIHQGTGEFEVVDDFSKVATGFINVLTADDGRTEQLWQSQDTSTDMSFDSNAIYNLLQERDYTYSGEFRSIYKCNDAFTQAQLIWNDNWITAIDGVLQLSALQRGHSDVSLPSQIHKLTISLDDHDKMQQVDDKILIPSYVSPVFDYARCGGILMEKIRFYDLPPNCRNYFRLVKPTKNKTEGKYTMPCNEKIPTAKDITLRSENIGDLNSLKWVQTHKLESLNDIVTVYYAGLNIIDANVAAGVIPPKQEGYGMDYSGVTATGSRVMGVVRGGAASSRVAAVRGLTWPVPPHWTLEDAATVPLAYAQAFYCLGIKVPLHPGMSILVQGAAGALGQAVISLALAHQCKVFATVGDNSKKKYLLKLYPELTEEMIGSSRDTSFADMVLLATEGKGCDVIICCSTGEAKNATLNCGAFSGIIIDTVQAHRKDSYCYGMNYMTLQRSYMMVDFYNIFENEDNIKLIERMMSEGISRGYVRPLSRVALPAQESRRALRLLAAARHAGRVLLRLQHALFPATPSLTCSPELHQLVVCSDDYLSFQFVDRLIKRGARNILLHSCPQTELFTYKEKSWKNLGAKVQILPRNLNSVKDFMDLLSNKHTEGIFFVCCENNQVFPILSKLDVASRICTTLKYFTIISATESSPAEQLCITRGEKNLPGSIVYLPPNMTQTTQFTSVSQRSLMNIIERALLSSERVLKIQLQPINEIALLKQIADLAEIKLPAKIKESTTLEEMGLNSSYSPAISAFLQHSYNVLIEVEQIPSLTIDLLEQIQQRISEPDFKEIDGLAAFFSAVNRDELMAVTKMMILPTLVKNPTVADHAIDLDKQYLWIVPGLEGQYERFRALCERLKMPALVLQPGTDFLDESVQETAQRYIKDLTARTSFGKHNTFYILGYETGVLTAFEMATILEAKGMTGTVFCIGGTPEQILSVLKNKLKGYNSKEGLEDAIIRQMSLVLCKNVVTEIDTCFNKGLTWKNKIEKAAQIIVNNSSYTSQFAQSIIDAAYARIKQSVRYKPQSYKLKSNVVLINTSSSKGTSTGNLEWLSQGLVAEYELRAPLSFAALHPRSASLVNSHLSANLIDEYEAQNHCELIQDADMFISKFSSVQEEDD